MLRVSFAVLALSSAGYLIKMISLLLFGRVHTAVPASLEMTPEVRFTLSPRPMQQAVMDGTPPAETIRMYENISSFYISQHLAEMSRGAKHLLDGKVNLTLTQVNLLEWEKVAGDEGTVSCPYTTCRLTSDLSAKTDGYIFSPYGEPPHTDCQ